MYLHLHIPLNCRGNGWVEEELSAVKAVVADKTHTMAKMYLGILMKTSVRTGSCGTPS